MVNKWPRNFWDYGPNNLHQRSEDRGGCVLEKSDYETGRTSGKYDDYIPGGQVTFHHKINDNPDEIKNFSYQIHDFLNEINIFHIKFTGSNY